MNNIYDTKCNHKNFLDFERLEKYTINENNKE